jgi:hypothetical protein
MDNNSTFKRIIRTMARGFPIHVWLLLGACCCLTSCTGYFATRRHFREHRQTYEAIVAYAKKSEYKPTNDGKYVFPKDLGVEFRRIRIHRKSFYVEFTPVNFYEVIVYAESESALKASYAYFDRTGAQYPSDPGVHKLDENWYHIGRDWN